MNVGAELDRLVKQRAGSRCEYCRMHQALQGATFHIEHVIPRVAGGESQPANLALACPGCNLRKGDRICYPDSDSGSSVRLFHPREDRWEQHFTWVGFEIHALSSTARATAALLELNHPRRLRIREAEAAFGWHPP